MKDTCTHTSRHAHMQTAPTLENSANTCSRHARPCEAVMQQAGMRSVPAPGTGCAACPFPAGKPCCQAEGAATLSIMHNTSPLHSDQQYH